MLDADRSCCPLLATEVCEEFAMSLQEQPSSKPYCSHGRRSYGYKEKCNKNYLTALIAQYSPVNDGQKKKKKKT